MKENEAKGTLEANVLSSRITVQIRALLAHLPPRSVEANILTRLNWRVEATVKAIVTEGKSLEGEVGRLQSAFILRQDEPMPMQLLLPEALVEDLADLSQLAEAILPKTNETN
jgi:hypothetical protein